GRLTPLGVKDETVVAIDDPRPHRYPSFGVVDSFPEKSAGGMAKRSAAMLGPSALPLVHLLCLLVLAMPLGCSVHPAAFEIVDYRDPGDAKRYRETFDEAYYDLDNQGNVNIVLRRSSGRSGAGESDVTQIVRIRSVWRPVPGKTGSHATQINATVSYYIVGGRIGDTFEGAGSVFFTQNRGKDTLSGSLDRAVLRPKRQLSPGEPLFARAELSGEFRAARDRRQVVRIMNEADRLFGPLPSSDDK
ncbi:MAG: hypothetical protein AAB363_02575, partial [Planctomycetota bacterium]